MSKTHILVLGDQLNRQVGPLADAVPEKTTVLMIESLELGHSLPHHKQKLIHCFSAMRHFAASLEADGFTLDYKRAEESFATGIAKHQRQAGGVPLVVMAPNDWGYEEMLRDACEAEGGSLHVVPNELWLTPDGFFADWAEGRKELRMEYFYRSMRARHGYLMIGDDPEGGQWNFDHDNRETPPDDYRFPDPPTFEPDETTREVIDFVKREFPDNFGDAEPFGWPVTREQALEALRDFCENRLRDFGPYEDAMVTGDYTLNHSVLSPLLNLGLLHPREVIETAIEHYRDGRRKIPVNSIEGFVRQILGWREFMHEVYGHFMPEMRELNRLNHRRSLPDFYWSGETRMNCMRQVVGQVRETAYAHHIQRLMILGTFAQIAQVNPQEVLDWFTACFIDALDWVMVPNVIGMSQYADLGTFTSKPYAASANYVNKMSDYCKGCEYDHKDRVGENSCPFNSLYWDFLNRHADEFRGNHRMKMMLANWDRQKNQEEVLRRTERVKELLRSGEI